ncbi:MAG TPA: sugar phosphate isomerase/epimerase family protein [Thermodesulfobacteriota bacterium]|nr:sugar phosphate isomerase/epimerase family protein [Thermodesulfobacteriota bacterium]
MKKQAYEQKNEEIRSAFLEMKKKHPERLAKRINLSWSNWGFGRETLAATAARLEKHGISFIELHGNHYGPDLGYKPGEALKILSDHGVRVAGICGIFSADNDLASNHAVHRQAAVDYIRRELEFAEQTGAGYMLIVPGAVGRTVAYDNMEFERSVETLRLVADLFVKHKVKATVEAIRSAEVTIVHTFAEVKRYVAAVDHPGVRHINGDVYHMQVEESHLGKAILEAGEMLLNLHMADSNRDALGMGSLDLDTIIRALYVVGFNTDGHYVTPEPLGPTGGDPYQAMHGTPDPAALDRLVGQTALYFREREREVLAE